MLRLALRGGGGASFGFMLPRGAKNVWAYRKLAGRRRFALGGLVSFPPLFFFAEGLDNTFVEPIYPLCRSPFLQFLTGNQLGPGDRAAGQETGVGAWFSRQRGFVGFGRGGEGVLGGVNTAPGDRRYPRGGADCGGMYFQAFIDISS